MQDRKRTRQTAFHYSWIRLPELHVLRLFENRRIEEHILQDHCGVVLERELGKIVGRIVVPASPWRRLNVYLDDQKGTCDLVQSSIDPNRNFSHRVAVPRNTENCFYYSATRDFLFVTNDKPRVWYDTEMQISLNEDRGQIAWILTQLVDRSDAQIHQLFIFWHRFIKNRERMLCCRTEAEKENFRQIAHQAIASIKAAWAGGSFFKALEKIDPDGSIDEIRQILRQWFPNIYHHYIDHPPEPIRFSRCPEREFRVEVSFNFDPKDASSEQPVYIVPSEKIQLTVPSNEYNRGTPKRCSYFYNDILGFVPEEVRDKANVGCGIVEIDSSEIKNSAEFWGDIAEVIKAFAIYQDELKTKLPPVTEILERFKAMQLNKAVLVR